MQETIQQESIQVPVFVEMTFTDQDRALDMLFKNTLPKERQELEESRNQEKN